MGISVMIQKETERYPLGVSRQEGGLRIAFVSGAHSCGIILEQKGEEIRVPFSEELRTGNVYRLFLKMANTRNLAYCFYESDDKGIETIVPDLYGKVFVNRLPFGVYQEESSFRAGFPGTFSWGEEKKPQLSYEESVVYCLHVRGFTRHASSGVRHKGTFAGLTEKIPYLKELGVNTLELQPAYEFAEKEKPADSMHASRVSSFQTFPLPELNYWGYKKGYYYAPKSSYAAAKDPCREFKEMVKALHRVGMEIVMQFYFSADIPALEIPNILKYWMEEYHIDGFHLIEDRSMAQLLAKDPGFSGVKLWYSGFDTDSIYGYFQKPVSKNLGVYEAAWQKDMRCFLKGDSGMLQTALRHLCGVSEQTGRIHYFSTYCGFTMMDMLSYTEKHNEANGEDNRDGERDNFSWNCGEEGSTRKGKVLALRKKQFRNAMMLLFLSAGTPLLFMGDEFGNSQKGNNNPYCQDNEISWVNWKDRKKNQDLYAFTKEVIAVRKAHPVFRKDRLPDFRDTLSCGYPDISYHGICAWIPSLSEKDRQAGIFYYGKYASDQSFYLAINLHWESKKLALPKLPGKQKWQLCMATDEVILDEAEGNSLVLPPRSIALYISNSSEEGNNVTRMETF